MSVDGRKALRDSAVAVVERIDGVANVIFRPDDNPARAWWRLDLGTVPISFVATVPSPEMATDVLADLYAVFPEAGVEARVVVEEGASPRGWPSTWVPLFRTLQERAPGARADVASGYLVLSGVTAAGPDDGLVPRLLGAAPGLALEVATDTVE